MEGDVDMQVFLLFMSTEKVTFGRTLYLLDESAHPDKFNFFDYHFKEIPR